MVSILIAEDEFTLRVPLFQTDGWAGDFAPRLHPHEAELATESAEVMKKPYSEHCKDGDEETVKRTT